MQKNLLLSLILTANIFLNTGCIAMMLGAAMGAGGVAYFMGDLVKNLDHPVKDVHKATLRALKELHILVLDDDVDAHLARFKAKLEDGRDVSIYVKAFTEKASKIKIRVGVVGDELEANKILNAIEKKL